MNRNIYLNLEILIKKYDRVHFAIFLRAEPHVY